MTTALLALDLLHDPQATVDAATPWLERLGARADAAWIDRHAATTAWARFHGLSTLWEAAREEVERDEIDQLRALVARLPPPLQGGALRLEGDPAEALADAGPAFDLVVIGTQGPSAALSGTGERILRLATRPVLVVRPGELAPSPRVLLAVDARDGAEALVTASAPWLRKLDARVEILHVEDTVPASWAEAMPVHDPLTPPAEERDLLDETLQRLARRLDSDLPVTTRVARGAPHRVVHELAPDFDLVVVGTHGRVGLSRLWLGSVTERVARAASTSVLVLHLPSAS